MAKNTATSSSRMKKGAQGWAAFELSCKEEKSTKIKKAQKRPKFTWNLVCYMLKIQETITNYQNILSFEGQKLRWISDDNSKTLM